MDIDNFCIIFKKHYSKIQEKKLVDIPSNFGKNLITIVQNLHDIQKDRRSCFGNIKTFIKEGFIFEEGKTYADTNYGESKCYPNYLNIYNTFKDQEADELKYTHKILVAFRELYTTINEKNKQKKLKLFTDENKFTKTGIQGANEYRSMTHTQVIDELLKRITDDFLKKFEEKKSPSPTSEPKSEPEFKLPNVNYDQIPLEITFNINNKGLFITYGLQEGFNNNKCVHLLDIEVIHEVVDKIKNNKKNLLKIQIHGGNKSYDQGETDKYLNEISEYYKELYKKNTKIFERDDLNYIFNEWKIWTLMLIVEDEVETAGWRVFKTKCLKDLIQKQIFVNNINNMQYVLKNLKKNYKSYRELFRKYVIQAKEIMTNDKAFDDLYDDFLKEEKEEEEEY